MVGVHPSSFNRRVRKLRRYLEALRQEILPELVGDPETLLIDPRLLSVLHPRQVSQSSGFEEAGWVRWGSFSLYAVKLHLICSTNRVPVCYELTPANVAKVTMTEELLAEANLSEGLARKVSGDLAYRGELLEEELAKVGIMLLSERARQRRGVRQHIEICFSSLKRVFGVGETLATIIIGLAIRIAAKITAYTYALYINRMLGRSQSRIKELWA